MTAPTGSYGTLQPQVVAPRPCQLETPDSYLSRLCAANVIDADYMRQLTTRRRRSSGRSDELGHVIAELGGPEPGHFRREYARSLILPPPELNDAFITSKRTRDPCSRCAAGEDMRTYDHRRFMICLKHKRWIGNRAEDQLQIVDHELRNVERRFRRIMASGLVSSSAHDAIVALIDRYSPELGEYLWLGHRRHDHPGIDRFPATTHILETIATYLDQNWPLELKIVVWHRRPEQSRLYDHLRAQLTWLGHPADNWKLIDELVQIVLDILGSRADSFSFDTQELPSSTS